MSRSLRCFLAFAVISFWQINALLMAASPDVPSVTTVPDALRSELKLADFYQKYIDLNGFPILGSSKVSDAAMREAAWIVFHELAEHPEILTTLRHNGARLVVMAHDEYTTDLPEQADWKPKSYWDRRARGMGGQVVSCAEENLLCLPYDPYSTENILIHEFAHVIHDYGLSDLVPDFDQRITKAYENAKAKGLWKGTYAGSNPHEYWAEAVQDWFDNNRQNDTEHNWVHTRAQLKEYDPEVAELCRLVLGDREWRYHKPMDRPAEERAHLADFDFDHAPGFAWRNGKPGSKIVPIAPEIPFEVHPLPLRDVRLTGGPLKHAQDLDAAYLLKLEPDRMLYFLRLRTGLEPKAKEGYDGWDGDGRALTGHIAGHYLSAVSYMYAATGDTQFKERADYIVSELKEIQDAQGDGYIGALMATVRDGEKQTLVDGKKRFEDLSKGVIQSGGFDLNGMWSPWYVEHKIFAGLRDAYRLTGNATALDVEIKFARWADGILAPLNDEQIQKMLGTEFGAMNEIMADLYADTGDTRWADANRFFEHHAIVDPLAKDQDILAGKHGNTQVPKLYGDLIHYLYSGDETSGEAARFFWDTVVDHHTFATGGHGKDEYFGEPDKLNDRIDGRTAETCNVYNMLKYSRTLFALHPDIKYADYMERALFNHILASMDDEDGRVCYMVPVGRGVTHEYQDPWHDFTCCVGTGMESHALHGDGIYYEAGDKLWVNLFAPSTAHWESQGARIEMQTDFPEGADVSLTVHLPSAKTLTFALRHPAWADEGFDVSVNGESLDQKSTPDSYLELTREWHDGDTIHLRLPKTLREEPLPDNSNRVALMWGPLVLAGDIGPEYVEGRNFQDLSVVPVFVTDNQPIGSWLRPVTGHPGEFRTDGVGRERDITLEPFYRLTRRAYAIYWDLYTRPEWEKLSQTIAAERDRQHQLELATVAFAQPGEMQSERDFNQQGEATEPTRLMGRAGRKARNWFSFDLPVDPSKPMALVVTYNSDEWRTRTFDILVDGQKIATETVSRDGAPHFYDVTYPISKELIQGKSRVTIRFEASKGNEVATVYGLRIIRQVTE